MATVTVELLESSWLKMTHPHVAPMAGVEPDLGHYLNVVAAAGR